jgi:hypothetical protein
MNNLAKRIKDLERQRPKPRRAIKEMSDKELEELICAELGIPASELTKERLEELIQSEQAKIATAGGGESNDN